MFLNSRGAEKKREREKDQHNNLSNYIELKPRRKKQFEKGKIFITNLNLIRARARGERERERERAEKSKNIKNNYQIKIR